MATIPFALSVSHFVSSVGADAGFAAIIGLALLVLLFFAQMRETATLREQAADSAEHVQQLEQRLATLARGVAAAAPATAPAPASVQRGLAPAQSAAAPVPSRFHAPGRVAVPAGVSSAPFAPAGVAAPALSSATRLIPSGAEQDISIRAAAPAAATGLAGAGAGAGVMEGGAGRGGAAVIAPPGPPPATAAGGANGRDSAPPPVGTGPAAPARTAAGSASRPPVRNGNRAAAAAAAPRRNYGSPPRGRSGGVLVALAVLVVTAAVVVGLLVLTSTGSVTSSSRTHSTAASATSATHHRATHARTTLKPSSVTAAVLNGTSTTNLAHDVSLKLSAAGYKLGTIATATDQTLTSTIVGYLPGHRDAAQIVAHSLGLPSGAVHAISQSDQAVACPQGVACTAQVVVTVGADLASVASSTTSAPASATTT